MSFIKVEGMEEYLRLLDLNERQLTRICGRSVYPGAGLAYKECKKRLQAVRTDDHLFKFAEQYNRQRKGITTRQKNGLIESLGIAPLKRKSGGIYDVKLGFDGYNDIVSPKYPKGQPNAMIARSLNKGTSFMESQPFMDQTIEAVRHPAEDAIEEQFYKELEKLWDKYFDRHG